MTNSGNKKKTPTNHLSFFPLVLSVKDQIKKNKEIKTTYNLDTTQSRQNRTKKVNFGTLNQKRKKPHILRHIIDIGKSNRSSSRCLNWIIDLNSISIIF